MNRTNQGLKIAVVGAGAIGGICAGLIKKAGYDVTVVVRREAHARQIMEEGIHIKGICGEFTVKMDALVGVENLTPDRDLVLLGVKATALADVAQKISSRLSPSAMVVSLQNGFCEQALADVLGRERVIGCVTGWGATLHSDCDLEMTSTGDFIVGNVDGKEDPRLEKVQTILNQVLPCLISNNIIGSLYSKLIINSCITSVGAVCGLFLGQMLVKKQVRLIFLRIMEEAMAVAIAMDINVEIFVGKLNYYTFLEETGLVSALKRHLFLLVLGFKYRKLKSSMLQSLERKQITEIEYLTGFIVENGRKHQIPTPVNDQIFNMVRQIEKGLLAISPDNLDHIQI